MPENRTILASNEELRRILVLLSQALTGGAVAVGLVLGGGWVYLGLLADAAVPTLLPVLTIAASAFAVSAYLAHEEICRIGKPYATSGEV